VFLVSSIHLSITQLVADSSKRVFSWGFGGYGRLGHADNKDEMVPRFIKSFEGPNKGATRIAAGSSFSFAVTEYGKQFCVKLKIGVTSVA